MGYCGYIQDVYGQLSEYELKRLETIRENQAFLSSISLLEAGMLLAGFHPPTALVSGCTGSRWLEIEGFFLFF